MLLPPGFSVSSVTPVYYQVPCLAECAVAETSTARISLTEFSQFRGKPWENHYFPIVWKLETNLSRSHAAHVPSASRSILPCAHPDDAIVRSHSNFLLPRDVSLSVKNPSNRWEHPPEVTPVCH